eukprot:3631660-Pyramimonas_sp.AAC.1
MEISIVSLPSPRKTSPAIVRHYGGHYDSARGALAHAAPEREEPRRLREVELQVVLLLRVAGRALRHRGPDEAPRRPAVEDRPDAARILQKKHQLAQLKERERARLG